MKIALCLSGQARHASLAIQSIRENVLPYNNCDIYIHTWFQKNGEPFQTSQLGQDGRVGLAESNTLQLLSDLNPKKMIIEKQIDFSDYVKGFEERQDGRQSQIASMFYSIGESLSMPKSKDYDLLVRARLDLVYQSKLTIETPPNGSIFVPKVWQSARESYTVNDCFAIGHPKEMSIYALTYKKMRLLSQEISPVTLGENYIGKMLQINGIKVYGHEINVDLAQRIIWKQEEMSKQ